jgi:hypothetical protein
MTMKVEIDGVLYLPVADRDELADLRRRIQSFGLEATSFWRDFFDERGGGGMYAEGDEFAPFFSEAFLYNLVGKDEARTILSLIRELCAAAGMEGRVV